MKKEYTYANWFTEENLIITLDERDFCESHNVHILFKCDWKLNNVHRCPVAGEALLLEQSWHK